MNILAFGIINYAYVMITSVTYYKLIFSHDYKIKKVYINVLEGRRDIQRLVTRPLKLDLSDTSLVLDDSGFRLPMYTE